MMRMSLSLSKCVEIKLKSCNINGKLTRRENKMKKLHFCERLRKTRQYTAFLAEAFACKDSGLLTGSEQLPSSIEEGHKLDVPSPSCSQVDCEDEDEQPSQAQLLLHNKYWNAATMTKKGKICPDVSSISKENCLFDRGGTIPVLSTNLKAKNSLNGILNSEYFSDSSKSWCKINSGNKFKVPMHWQSISSTQNSLKSSISCLPSVCKQKGKWLFSKRLKENDNYSNLDELLNLESIPNRSQILPTKCCAPQNPLTSLRHSRDAIKKSLMTLLENFGNSRHVLWQCQFCPYSGTPLRVKHHIAMRHLAVPANENRLFGCPHCDGEFASAFTFRRHLRRVHAGKGMRPCPHCNMMVPYQKLGSHIFCHINEHVAAVTHSTASTKEQLPATTPSSATGQLAVIGQSVMPALLATAQSALTATKTTGSKSAAIEVHIDVSAETERTHIHAKTQSTKKLEETLTSKGKCVKQFAEISRSKALHPIKPKTSATAPVWSLEKGLSNGILEQPYPSKVSLEAVSIIYQSIEKEGVNHCPICLFSSNKPDLLKHLFENHLTANHNHNGEIICPHCDYVSLTGENYNVHLQIMHTTLYPCPLCSTVLPQPESLLRHLTRHVRHKIASLEKENVGRPSRKQRPNKLDAKSLHNVLVSTVLQRYSRGKFKCALCYYCTKKYSSFKRHLGQSHLALIRNKRKKIKCAHCTQVFLQERCYKSHLRVYHSGKLSCPHCSQQFSVYHHLENHLITHIQPFVQLEYLQDVPFAVRAAPSTSTGCMEVKLEDYASFDCCCSRPLITAEQTLPTICAHHRSHGHSADIDTNSLGKRPSKHDFYSCANGLDEVTIKHEPWWSTTETQHAKHLKTTGHDEPLMPVLCTSEEGLEVPLPHVHYPCTDEHVGSLKHHPCSCTEDTKPVCTEHHFRLASNENCIGPLCNRTSATFRDFPSHLPKVHQNARSCFNCSLCNHTEEVPSSIEMHAIGRLNSDCVTNLDGNKHCNSSHCYNVDCKKEIEESESDLLHCSFP